MIKPIKIYSARADYLHISLFLAMLFFELGLVGTYLNNKVMLANEGRMPVKDWYDTTTHFSFSDNSEVNYPYLADIFHMGGRIYSIGDFFLYLCYPLGIYVIFRWVRWSIAFIKFKREKEQYTRKRAIWEV